MRIRASQAPALLLFLVGAALLFLPSLVSAQPAKLLITQVETRGNPSDTDVNEYIVIKNPGSAAVDLTDYYLTDATFRSSSSSATQFYFNLPDESLPVGGGSFSDFTARFPSGFSIAAGAEISISVNGSNAFEAAYGKTPTFELYEDGVAADGVPDMVPARDGSINGSSDPTLTNGGETVVLFHWDGSANLVTDIDYFLWGETRWATDKTGVSITATGGSEASTYQPDIAIESQSSLMQVASPTGTFVRTDANEGNQASSGSNGVDGRSETSENLIATFSNNTDGVPPGTPPTDTTPPTLVGAGGGAGTGSIGVTFSEPVGAGAETTSNYTVFETATPGNTLAVTAASAASGSGALVTLTVDGTLLGGVNYTIEVSNVEDLAGNVIAPGSRTAFTPVGGEGFFVAGVYQFGPSQFAVAYSALVNSGQATTIGNYTIAPTGGAAAITVSSIEMQANGSMAILTTSGNLPLDSTYNVSISGVSSVGGDPLASGGPFTLVTSAVQVIGMDEVHANPGSFDGEVVTVIGQVFAPPSVVATRYSGYFQDATGYGLQLFDFSTTPPVEFSTKANVVQVTGAIDVFNSILELTDFASITVLAESQPELGPAVLSPSEAANSRWNMSYIQTTSTLTSGFAVAGTGYQNASAGAITFRAKESLGIDFGSFSSGDEVTGRGAGGEFNGTFQLEVGTKDDFFMGGGGPDLRPPTLVSAAGNGGSAQLQVVYSESVGEGANVAANYEVFETATPTTTLNVTNALVDGSRVTLTMESNLVDFTGYTVRVNNVEDLAGNVIAPNSTVSFTATGVAAFQVAGLFQFGRDRIGVTYGKDVDPASATTIANYTITPQGGAAALTVGSIILQDNQQMAILVMTGNLPASSTYGIDVANVTSKTGESLGTPIMTEVSTAATAVLNIDEIHADLDGFDGQTVTVTGQVFHPAGVVATRYSGYLQDGSARGLQLFGFSTSPPQEFLDTGNIIRVTGDIDVFNEIIEITGFTDITVLVGNQPELGPAVVSPAEVADSRWNMSFVQSTATLVSGFAPAGTGYQNADAGAFEFRVKETVGINYGSFTSGDEVTGRGAGGEFLGTFQMEIGTVNDFFKGGGGPDETPPTLVSAAGTGGESQVVVVFSESVGSGAGTATNYEVYETANPTAIIAVTNAVVTGANVGLVLGSNMLENTQYTVRVNNVEDLAGNVILPNSTVNYTTGGATVFQVVGVFQFGRDRMGVNYGKKVNEGSATNIGNYAITPLGGAAGVTISSIELQDNEHMAIIFFTGDLPQGASYEVGVSGVTGKEGEALQAPLATTFSTATGNVVNIDEVHADLPGFDTEVVTIVGQVFHPAGVVSTRYSGYIQDGSARGLQLFDFSTSPPQAFLDKGNIVRVTGAIDIFETTIEITDFTDMTVVASSQPWLGARVVSPNQAASSEWNMSFIQTTTTLQAGFRPAGTGYQNADAGALEWRIKETVGVDFTSFQSGDEVTGRGAGGEFGGTFQIEVGAIEDFFKGAGGDVDTTRSEVASVEVPALTLLRGASEPFPVKFGAKSGSNVVVRVFDLQGRLSRVLFDGSVGAAKETILWDGRDDTFEYLPTGMYVCHVEAIDPGGSITSAHAPIVISVRLK